MAASQTPLATDDLDAEQSLESEASPDSEVEIRARLVEPAEHGQRLDKLLVATAPEFSRSWLQQLIDRGHVTVDEQVQTTASRKLKAGQRLRLALVPTAQSQAFKPEAMALDVVFEDDHLLVVNKPVGLVVHPAAGHWSGTLLNGLLAHHPGASALPRAGIVHRLDKDTTGLMVVAKTQPAMTALVRMIAAREVHRVYMALAHGEVAWREVSIDAPIGRDPASRLRMAVVASGKPARTDVRRLAVLPGDRPALGFTALRCKLHSGRTHQIRVHMAHKGHPLVADAIYGGKPALGMTRQALHAAELAFAHPIDGQAISFECPLPPDLAAAWALVMAD